jgi:hypothetical protein
MIRGPVRFHPIGDPPNQRSSTQLVIRPTGLHRRESSWKHRVTSAEVALLRRSRSNSEVPPNWQPNLVSGAPTVKFPTVKFHPIGDLADDNREVPTEKFHPIGDPADGRQSP